MNNPLDDFSIPKQFLDKSKFFIDKHNLPEDEGLIRNIAGLILLITTDKDVRIREQKFLAKTLKKKWSNFRKRLHHLKDEYHSELQFFGLSKADINAGIEFADNYPRSEDRAHHNKRINIKLGALFFQLTEMDIKPTKQWYIVHDLFIKYSLEIEEDEDMGSDYYQRIKAVYKKSKKRISI